ncbi:MAG: SigB/SigF/SigG family RNA polymerase sigma factor [Actinomycetota bacterium]
MSSPSQPQGPAAAGARNDREAAIIAHLGLARALARRYANRGEPLDDLEQVAIVGLINAVDRFDPSKGADFRSFAAPTILGELRRHFRDRAWAMRVPRGLKDDYARVTAAVEALTGRLGRTPGVSEIAAEAHLSDEQVLDAIAAHGAYRPQSLSVTPWTEEEGSATDIATEEPGYERAEGRTVIERGMRHLPSRERVILHLRFEEGLIQSEIAERLGISQMHVSRLISRALETLRRVAEEGEP